MRRNRSSRLTWTNITPPVPSHQPHASHAGRGASRDPSNNDAMNSQARSYSIPADASSDIDAGVSSAGPNAPPNGSLPETGDELVKFVVPSTGDGSNSGGIATPVSGDDARDDESKEPAIGPNDAVSSAGAPNTNAESSRPSEATSTGPADEKRGSEGHGSGISISGGVTSLISTTSHKACVTAGPKRRQRQTPASSNARQPAATVFEMSGAKIRTASSAREALELMHQQPPDVVITDIGMPDMDGYGLLREIRRTSHVPVIALTAYARSEDQELIAEAGFDGLITKPVEPAQLRSAVTDVLAKV